MCWMDFNPLFTFDLGASIHALTPNKGKGSIEVHLVLFNLISILIFQTKVPSYHFIVYHQSKQEY